MKDARSRLFKPSAILAVVAAGVVASFCWPDLGGDDLDRIRGHQDARATVGISEPVIAHSSAPSNSAQVRDHLPAGQLRSNEAARAGMVHQWYGDRIRQAFNGTRDADALEAVQLLWTCQNATGLRDGLDKIKLRGRRSAEEMAMVIGAAERELQQCQTVTPEMMAWEAPLARRAALSGLPGAASMYVRNVNYEIPSELGERVVSRLRADARDGQIEALFDFALHGRKLGLSRVEERSYVIASEPQLTKAQNYLLKGIEATREKLSAEQEAEANKLAMPIIESGKKY